MTNAEFVRLLKKEGFKFDHHGTRHDYYSKGDRLVMVGRHQSEEISTGTLNKMLKNAGLK